MSAANIRVDARGNICGEHQRRHVVIARGDVRDERPSGRARGRPRRASAGASAREDVRGEPGQSSGQWERQSGMPLGKVADEEDGEVADEAAGPAAG